MHYTYLSMRKRKGLFGGPAGSGESSLIRRIADSTLPGMESRNLKLPLGIGDDAALFRPKPGFETILTCDWFLEGTHFLPAKHPPDSVGWKCLARAVSDVAAMGGVPRCFLLSLALPASRTGRWLDQFLRGIRRASRAFKCRLVGGDTTRRSDILVNVTVVGEVRSKHALLRSGARSGDLIYVSGRLGEADYGLCRVRNHKGRLNPKAPELRRHLYPEPRLALGRWLAEKGLATAMMDLSDGLSTDLARLCGASGVGAQIKAWKIPTIQMVKHRPNENHDLLELALNGGDDYELLFTVPQRKARFVPATLQKVPLTPIGTITRDKHLLVIEKHGRELPLIPKGWDPFR